MWYKVESNEKGRNQFNIQVSIHHYTFFKNTLSLQTDKSYSCYISKLETPLSSLLCSIEAWQRNDIKLRECPLQGKFTPFAIELWGIPLNVHCTLSPQISKKMVLRPKACQIQATQKNTLFKCCQKEITGPILCLIFS